MKLVFLLFSLVVDKAFILFSFLENVSSGKKKNDIEVSIGEENVWNEYEVVINKLWEINHYCEVNVESQRIKGAMKGASYKGRQ